MKENPEKRNHWQLSTTIPRLIFLTALLTGIRLGELFGLWWEDFDWNSNAVCIQRALYWQDGKNHTKEPGADPWVYVLPKSEKSAREIDLSPALRNELLEKRKDWPGLPYLQRNALPAGQLHETKLPEDSEACGHGPSFLGHKIGPFFRSC